MKKVIIIIIVILLVVIGVVLGVRVVSGEDNWMCQNGEWVKHGNPEAPKPTGECKK